MPSLTPDSFCEECCLLLACRLNSTSSSGRVMSGMHDPLCCSILFSLSSSRSPLCGVGRGRRLAKQSLMPQGVLLPSPCIGRGLELT